MLDERILLDLGILVRLVVALALAGVVGWERETSGKAAGLRTHMFVGMGAALFVALGELLIRDFQHVERLQTDPLRLVEAVVAAIGFLGAGTIFVSRGRNHVYGLTTAASLWVTAAIGIAVGLEHYVLAIGTTALVFVVLRFLLPLSLGPEGDADRQSAAAVEDREPPRLERRPHSG
jgi:putative Mg2+ transporter-C (MgtC) family protein